MNKALILNLLKLSWDDWTKPDQGNTCLNVLSRREDGTWFPDKLNCTVHLTTSIAE